MRMDNFLVLGDRFKLEMMVYTLCVFSLSEAAAHSNMFIYVIISCIIGYNFSGRKLTLFISQ